jgi:hypothetical protein
MPKARRKVGEGRSPVAAAEIHEDAVVRDVRLDLPPSQRREQGVDLPFARVPVRGAANQRSRAVASAAPTLASSRASRCARITF